MMAGMIERQYAVVSTVPGSITASPLSSRRLAPSNPPRPDGRCSVPARSKQAKLLNQPLMTPDGRYIVVRGRLWRAINPGLASEVRAQLVQDLMTARRDVRSARRKPTVPPSLTLASGWRPRRSAWVSGARYGGKTARPSLTGEWPGRRPMRNGLGRSSPREQRRLRRQVWLRVAGPLRRAIGAAI